MPRNYSGTPLESDYDRLQRRRAINDAIVKQSMAPYTGTEMVSGRAVDDRWGQGLSKIGQAIIGRYGNKSTDKEASALNEKFDAGRDAGMAKVMDALSNTGAYGPQKPDPQKAGTILATNPYLQKDAVGRALINSGAYGSGGYPSYQFLPTAKGYAKGNRRTGDVEHVEGDFIRSQDDVNLQTNLGYGKQLGTGRAEAATDPITKSRVTQAQKDVELGMNPQIAGEVAREAAQNKAAVELDTVADLTKAKMAAESQETRAQTATGTNQLIGEAKAILEGDVKPTSSGVGALYDWAASMVGKSPEGAVEAAQLKVIGGALVGKVPRFEGPQSDRDIGLYKEMAGRIGDSGVPIDQRLGALKKVQSFWAQYEKTKTATPPADKPGQPFSDEEKERRYQEWKASQ